MQLPDKILGFGLEAWVFFLLGTIISLWLYRLQKRPKTVDYAQKRNLVVPSGSIPSTGLMVRVWWSTSEGLAPTEHALAAGTARELASPAIYEYRIKNTGKRAIDATDFAGPVTISVADGEIQYVYVTAVSTDGVADIGMSDGDGQPQSRGVRPNLMNPGEWFDIQVVTDKSDEEPKLTARIREQTRPMRRRDGLLDPPLWQVIRSSIRDTDSGARYNLVMWVFSFIAAVAAVAALFIPK